MCMFANGPFAHILSLFMNIHFTRRICCWWSTKKSILSHVLAAVITVDDAKVHSETLSSVSLILFPFSVTAGFVSFCICYAFSLWITLLGSWKKKQLYFRRKYTVLFASFLWRWVGVCMSEVKSTSINKTSLTVFLLEIKRTQTEHDLNLSGQFGMVSASSHLIYLLLQNVT